MDNEYLPYDDLQYLEHRARDKRGDHGYFVVNTMAGEVVVNGQKIGCGEVAGPLPAFAVIECPGRQVCFWWGENGRNWGNGGSTEVKDTAWAILRQRKEWQHIARSAGEVWDDRIIDRLKREETGAEGEVDDEEWDRYKQFSEPNMEQTGATVRPTVGVFFTTFLTVIILTIQGIFRRTWIMRSMALTPPTVAEEPRTRYQLPVIHLPVVCLPVVHLSSFIPLFISKAPKMKFVISL